MKIEDILLKIKDEKIKEGTIIKCIENGFEYKFVKDNGEEVRHFKRLKPNAAKFAGLIYRNYNFEIIEKSNKRWRAEKNKQYFHIDDYGDVCCSFEYFGIYDEYRYDNYNYFKTEEEAEHYLELLQIETELRQFAEKNNEKIDWNDNNSKYKLVWLYQKQIIDIYTDFRCRSPRTIYFTSEELAEQAIEKVGKERVEMYLKEL